MQIALLAILISSSFTMLVASMILSIVMYGKLISQGNTITKLDGDSERIKHSSQRLQSQLEVILNELNSPEMFPQSNTDGAFSGQQGIFKSLDGKYEATSFQELVEKMNQDPDYKKMRDMMEGDEDDEDKPWEKGN